MENVPTRPKAEDGGAQWNVVYPQYLNSELTLHRGRRLPKDKCVTNPNWKEIADVLFSTPDKFEIQAYPDKCYPRELDKELWNNRGYVRYRTKDDSFKTKRDILLFICSRIPELAVRKHPDYPNNVVDPMMELSQRHVAQQQQQSQEASSSKAAGGSSGSGGGGGGGGKKKKGRK